MLRRSRVSDERTTKRYQQPHLQPRVRRGIALKTAQRAFGAFAAFDHERQVKPDRRISDREVGAKGPLSPSRGEGPVESRANVVDLSNTAR